MGATYPDVARGLLERCAEYRRRTIDLAALKAAVWSASTEIVLPEERNTHDFLQRAEGTLDMAEHTVDDERLFDVTVAIVSGIEQHLTRYLESDAAP